MLADARKDHSHITPQGVLRRDAIEGVVTREGSNVITRNGVTTELFRSEWEGVGGPVAQMIHASLRGHAISAWHCHERQTDRIAVLVGTVRLVLFDARNTSPTRGTLEVFGLSPMRPTLVVVPPGIWHGLQNLESGTSAFVNFFDRSYRHDDPDEWRLPVDTDAIPYRF